MLRVVPYVSGTENEHQISSVSLSEAMNIIYVSTSAADLSDHLPGNTNDTCLLSRDSYNVIPVKALGSTVSPQYNSCFVCLSACLSESISMYNVY